MRRTFVNSLRYLLVLAVSASLSASVLAQGNEQKIDKATKEAVVQRMGQVVLNSCYVPGVDFGKWPEFLTKSKDAIDKAETESQFAEAINKELSSYFGVSHIVLITPRNAKARIERKVVGVGIQVQLEPEGLRIVSVFPNTPASEAGLDVGDLVMEADGKKLTTTTGMLGEEGTPVEIKVKKGDGKVKAYKLVRRKYSNVREDTITFPSPNTALITVHTFDTAYSREKVDELFEKAANVPNLILDLRSNGGGIVLNMLHFLGHLLPANTGFGTFINRNMVKRYADATNEPATDLRAIASFADAPLKPRVGSEPYKGNVAVLINGGTGSASEISALALKEFRQAPVVGTKSAGAVLVSVMGQLPNGWVLQYPMMDYVSALGVRIEGKGIEPDIQAPTPRLKEPDTGVDKALALLQRIELRKERGGNPDGKRDGALLLL